MTEQELLGYMDTMSNLLIKIKETGKMDDFKKNYLENPQTREVDFSFRALISKRKEILEISGYNPVDFQAIVAKQKEAINTETAQKEKVAAEEKAAKEKVEKEKIQTERDTILKKMITETTSVPVTIKWDNNLLAKAKTVGVEMPEGKIGFNSEKQQIFVGDKKFTMTMKVDNPLVTEPKGTGLNVE